MKQQKEEYIPVQGDRVLVEEGEGRVVAVHEQRRTATILMDDGKTVVSSWEDVGRTEGEEDGAGSAPPPRMWETRDPHAEHEHYVQEAAAPRSRRERNERSERPAHRRHTGEGGGRRTPREAKRSQGQHRAVRARRTEQIPSE